MTPQNDRLDLSFNLSGHLISAKMGAYEGMGARRKLGENWQISWDNFSDMLGLVYNGFSKFSWHCVFG